MESLMLKTNYKGDIRKIRIKRTRYVLLKESVKKAYNLELFNFRIFYTDEEGDNITIGNEEDLKIALESLQSGKMLKVLVKAWKTVQPEQTVSNLEVVNPTENGEEIPKPLLKLQKPKPKENEIVKPLLKLEKPKPKPKEKKEEELKPLLKLEKPKPKSKEVETVRPLLKLEKPKPKEVETVRPLLKLEKPKPKEEETVRPLLKLEKPKPKPNEKKEEVKPLLKLEKPKPKENEIVKPLLKLEKPKPKPNEKKEELKPLLKLEKPKPKEVETVRPLLKLEKPKPKEDTVISVTETTKQETTVQKSFAFIDSLNEMISMGFPDGYQLRSLLLKNNGDLESTVSQLLN